MNPVIPIKEKNMGTTIDTITSRLASASKSSGLGIKVVIVVLGNCNSLMVSMMIMCDDDSHLDSLHFTSFNH